MCPLRMQFPSCPQDVFQAAHSCSRQEEGEDQRPKSTCLLVSALMTTERNQILHGLSYCTGPQLQGMLGHSHWEPIRVCGEEETEKGKYDNQESLTVMCPPWLPQDPTWSLVRIIWLVKGNWENVCLQHTAHSQTQRQGFRSPGKNCDKSFR